MTQEKVKIKAGMAGSSAGRERSAKTSELKSALKNARRREGKEQVTLMRGYGIGGS